MSKRLVTVIGAAIVICAIFIGTRHDFQWRLEIVADRALGNIQDISWAELFPMLLPGSGIYLEKLASLENPYAVIKNPLGGTEAAEMGSNLYATHCRSCHGVEGALGSAPALDGGLRGHTDWAIFRIVKYGIEGSAMPRHNMPSDDIWRIVSHLRSLRPSQNQVAETHVYPTVSTDEIGTGIGRDEKRWLTYSGSYFGDRYSALEEINSENIQQLSLEWAHQTSSRNKMQASVLVNGRYLFLPVPPNQVLALDSKTGSLIWSHEWSMPREVVSCCGFQNRGVALFGSSLFVATFDGRLRALEASTGKLLWETRLVDYRRDYHITSAPLAIPGRVIVPISGGQFGAPGRLIAVDSKTGQILWSFNTIADDENASSWAGESAKHGGAAPWMTGSYDPERDWIYWGTGHPAPSYNGDVRKGDNLYSSSLVVLDGSTGQRVWHFQFTPHNEHGWDAAQVPILYDEPHGERWIVWPNRNAFYYRFSRQPHEFRLAHPFAHQTWATEILANGRPVKDPSATPSKHGTLVFPNYNGATNWWASSLDLQNKRIYVPVLERGEYFYKHYVGYEAHEYYDGGSTRLDPQDRHEKFIRALDVMSGELIWEKPLAATQHGLAMAGTLSTGGNLVFTGDATDFIAIDADKGEEIWRVNLGGKIGAAPVTYAVDGKQYVSIVADRTLYTFSLRDS